MERENLHGDAKGKGASGANREAESTDAPVRGGLLCSSDETGEMPAERRKQAIAIWIGSTGNGRNPMLIPAQAAHRNEMMSPAVTE
jgi:hypothetical protein